MKPAFIVFLSILFILTEFAPAQTHSKQLNALSQRLKQTYTSEHQKALDMARQKNWPIKKRLQDGAVAELIRLAPNGMPLYYITNNINAARTVSTNQVWPGGSTGLNLTGSGMLVGEWDAAGVLTSHQEFNGRVTQRDTTDGLNNHSTHVAGTLIASGVQADAQGMSYEARLDAYDWNNDESEMAAAAGNGLLLSNHSYGYVTGWYWNWINDNRWAWFGDTTISATEDYNFGFYSAHTQEWDQVAYDAPNYLIVVAAGNERDDDGPSAGEEHWIWDAGTGDWVLATASRDPDGQYDCISFAALAKNILTVGAVNDIAAGYSAPSDVVMSSFSSWGPADDGRLKPDITANGVNLYSTFASNDSAYGSYSGTSMATPNTTGSLLLLQQYYQQTHNDAVMRAATLKALAIHTADEAGDSDGPDYAFGWGLLNTAKAAQAIQQDGSDVQIIEETLSEDGSYSYRLNLAENSALTATLVWPDPPATPVAAALDPSDIMLINDLDLRITKDGQTFYPYVLDGANPSQAATTGDNRVDNVEKIFLENPGAGTYTLTVNHKNTLQGGSQDFSLIISGHKSASAKPAPINIVAGDGFDHMTPLSWDPVDSVSILSTANKRPLHGECEASIQNYIPNSATATTDTISHYKVYRSTSSGGPYTFLAEVHTNNRSYGNNEDYIDHSALNGTTYYYVITAVYTDGEESDYSAEVASTPATNGYHRTLNLLSVTPTIDGQISSSEWTDASAFDITSPGVTQPITMYLKNDRYYFYIAVDDPNNTTTSDLNSIGLYFDDDNNDTWDVDENTDEGNFWISNNDGSISIDFRGIYGSYPDSLHFVSSITNPTGVEAEVTANSGHLQYEVRVDLLNSVLSALPGDEIGFRIYNKDGSNMVSSFNGFSGNWPYGAIWVAPENYGKIRLAQVDSATPPPVNLVAGTGFDSMIPLTWDPAWNVATLKTHGKKNNNSMSAYGPYAQTSQMTTEDTVSYYKIYRSTQPGGPYSFLTEVHTDARNYSDNEDYIDADVTNNTAYYYVITAVYTNGAESDYSAEASAMPIAGGYHATINASQKEPVLDGFIASDEWNDAKTFDITAPGVTQTVIMYLKNDPSYLYIAVDDPNNTSASDYDLLGIYFDDDNNNTWDADNLTDEGNFWISYDNGSLTRYFRGIYGVYPDSIGFVSSVTDPAGVDAQVSFSSGHIQYEVKIDLQNSVLSASPGDEIGFWLFDSDGSSSVDNYYGLNGNWPYGSVWTAPLNYGKIKLAETTGINDLQLVSYIIDDDKIYQSVGNADGQANPGEFLEVLLTVQNTSTVNSYHNLYIVPDSSFDPYVHPNPAYFYDGYLKINNIDPQQTVDNFDDFDFFVSSFTPNNHTLIIPLTFYDENDNIIGKDTLRIPVTGRDTQAPFLMQVDADPGYSAPGSAVTVTAWLKEASTSANVMAFIQNPDGVDVRDLPLLSTGKTDKFQGEQFEGTFTNNTAADFVVDIGAEDQFMNAARFDNVTRFTQKPFEKQHDILLVADDAQWRSDFSDVYEAALSENQLAYDIWRNWVRGMVDSTTLLKYKDGIVIWYCAGHFPQLDSLERENVAAYLDDGGKLFITDQDIGYYIFTYENSEHGKDWYEHYLHADYISDNARLYGVNGVSGDSITDGLELELTVPYYGGGWWPSIIQPIEPATMIFNYDPADTVPAQNIYLNEKLEPVDDLAGAATRSAHNIMSEDHLGAGIRYDSGNYKLVYLSFPFESIKDSTAGKELLYKILYWLNPQLIVALENNEGTNPISYRLRQNYPNPFNPETQIRYSLPVQTHVTLQVYDVLGRLVTTLTDGLQKAGAHEITWKGQNQYGKIVSSGVYILRMQAGNFVRSRKMIFMK